MSAIGPRATARSVGTVEEQVRFDTNRAIRDTFGAVGFPAPEQRVLVRSRG